MDEPILVWDLPDDPDGSVAHIAEHGLTPEEIESVVRDPANPTAASDSSDRPITFGWTDTVRYVAVVWEPVMDDPRRIYPVTAYEGPPPAARRRRRNR